MRVVLVEDDDHYRDAVEEDLAKDGFTVHCFSDDASLLAAVTKGLRADAVVVNWTLGIDLIPQMRTRGLQWPVVFLSGPNSPAHEELAFRRGAEDFVDKARGCEVLADRLRRIATQHTEPDETQADHTFRCGSLVLKLRTSRAFWNGVDVRLTLMQFKMVKLLASQAGSFLSHRAMYDAMRHAGFTGGSGEDGYRTNVRAAVKRTRNKFKLISPDFDAINTYISFGYRWESPDIHPRAAEEAKGAIAWRRRRPF